MEAIKPIMGRYSKVTEEKVQGATYTPKILADFVSQKIIEATDFLTKKTSISIFDPAVGDGALLNSLILMLRNYNNINIVVNGYETNQNAIELATRKLERNFKDLDINIKTGNFLEYVVTNYTSEGQTSLFKPKEFDGFDIIIANPPYVRTQIIGVEQSRLLAHQFGLTGRVDLYHAFLIGITRVLKSKGIAGIIVSNRFMTTKSGKSVRKTLKEKVNIKHIWDLGDTKLFNVAVLPAVLLISGKGYNTIKKTGFTSIYETNKDSEIYTSDAINALSKEGVVEIDNGRRFIVKHGELNTSSSKDSVWRITTSIIDDWLKTVKANTWGDFRRVGKIHVGVKTCADKVFIRSDWNNIKSQDQPELLKPLITHRFARRFKSIDVKNHFQILYPHKIVGTKCKPVNLNEYPNSLNYLEKHRTILENRKYILDSGRKWYEIWIPQNPAAWDMIKLVFRDISEKPIFWIDKDGMVVNGDCYWLVCDKSDQTNLLWLAVAVGNSTFIEKFYDYRFHNKLYAGRRRFITQYVEQFPLPDPNSIIGKEIINKAIKIYELIDNSNTEHLEEELNGLVWQAFGLPIEEVSR